MKHPNFEIYEEAYPPDCSYGWFNITPRFWAPLIFIYKWIMGEKVRIIWYRRG